MKKPWSDRLPRRVRGLKCMVLEMNGSPCRNRAVVEDSYHGDGELYYGDHVSWVRLPMCRKHALTMLDKDERIALGLT